MFTDVKKPQIAFIQCVANLKKSETLDYYHFQVIDLTEDKIVDFNTLDDACQAMLSFKAEYPDHKFQISSFISSTTTFYFD